MKKPPPSPREAGDKLSSAIDRRKEKLGLNAPDTIGEEQPAPQGLVPMPLIKRGMVKHGGR
jgi:hypothetical protein